MIIFEEFSAISPLNYIIIFRILSSFQMTSGDPFAAIEQSIATYADVYKAIYAGQQVTCAIKGTVFDAISAPSVIVMDVCLFSCIQRRIILYIPDIL